MNNKRFEIIYKQSEGATTTSIMLDKETGVKYLIYKAGPSATMTQLVENDIKSTNTAQIAKD